MKNIINFLQRHNLMRNKITEMPKFLQIKNFLFVFSYSVLEKLITVKLTK